MSWAVGTPGIQIPLPSSSTSRWFSMGSWAALIMVFKLLTVATLYIYSSARFCRSPALASVGELAFLYHHSSRASLWLSSYDNHLPIHPKHVGKNHLGPAIPSTSFSSQCSSTRWARCL